jgi:hypothetical protein
LHFGQARLDLGILPSLAVADFGYCLYYPGMVFVSVIRAV